MYAQGGWATLHGEIPSLMMDVREAWNIVRAPVPRKSEGDQEECSVLHFLFSLRPCSQLSLEPAECEPRSRCRFLAGFSNPRLGV